MKKIDLRKKYYFKKKSIIPGFGPALGFTLFYLGLVVLLPLSTLFLKTATLTWPQFWATLADPRVVASFKLSFGAAAAAALINAVFGLLTAWVLVRYDFPGKRLIDGLVDLPFALPTAVAGIALTSLYAETGAFGKALMTLGIKAAFTPLGIVIALTFIGLPFVVRTLQPVLQDLEKEIEDAAASLGATPRQTFFLVILPVLRPALITGTTLAFARAVGEYGSVVFISGNMPMSTEIAPLLIMTKLEQFDYAGATAVAVGMLAVSFTVMLAINLRQWLSRSRAAA